MWHALVWCSSVAFTSETILIPWNKWIKVWWDTNHILKCFSHLGGRGFAKDHPWVVSIPTRDSHKGGSARRPGTLFLGLFCAGGTLCVDTFFLDSLLSLESFCASVLSLSLWESVLFWNVVESVGVLCSSLRVQLVRWNSNLSKGTNKLVGIVTCQKEPL